MLSLLALMPQVAQPLVVTTSKREQLVSTAQAEV